jgi:UDP-glucose 4-epimerase
MKTIIFGKRSNLTTSIVKKITNFEVISSNDIDYSRLRSANVSKKNFIFNNFYPAYKLNNLEPKQYDIFLDNSLVHLVKILSCLNPKKINKIIYTSSSSIYGLYEDLKFIELDKYNRKIYASFKYSAEKIVQNFCQKNNVNFYIMRLFNTYGDSKDKFSFIEKLINVKKKN